MSVSIICGHQIDSVDTLERFAELCTDDGYDRLWMGQSLLLETFAAFAALAGRGVQVPCGSAVSVAGLRSPYDAAVQARSAAALSGQPFAAGFGLGTPDFAAGLNGGRPLQRPGRFTADYVREVARLLDPDARALTPMPAPPVEVGSGVLRPRMARKAGAVADFVVTWLSPLEHLTQTLMPAVAAGAQDAGRPAPRTVCVVQAAVAAEDRHPYKLAYLACGAHLQGPHYQAALRQGGIDITGDVAHDVQEVVHAGVYAYGSVDTLCETVAAYHRAGVDEVVLNFSGVGIMHGLDAALDDARAVSRALAGAPQEVAG